MSVQFKNWFGPAAHQAVRLLEVKMLSLSFASLHTLGISSSLHMDCKLYTSFYDGLLIMISHTQEITFQNWQHNCQTANAILHMTEVKQRAPVNKVSLFNLYSPYFYGVCSGAVEWGTALQAGRSQVQFPMVSLEFFIDIILLAALWPWGWHSLQQKHAPERFPWGGQSKGGWCIGLTTLPPSCANCLEIWEPQHPGTLRALRGL
jgi:hypothetical protein